VLNLDYLFDTIVQQIKPLDFPVLWEKHTSSKLELKVSFRQYSLQFDHFDHLCPLSMKVVASGLLSRKAVVLSATNGNFRDIGELAECMKASMLIPGLTGDVVRLKVLP